MFDCFVASVFISVVIKTLPVPDMNLYCKGEVTAKAYNTYIAPQLSRFRHQRRLGKPTNIMIAIESIGAIDIVRYKQNACKQGRREVKKSPVQVTIWHPIPN